jgi:hypothetical protein
MSEVDMRGAVAAAILWTFVTLAVDAANTGSVRLAIRDVNGDTVAGATVDLDAVGRPGKRQVATDSRGEVTFGSLVPGLYEATVTLEGFSTSVLRVEVRQNETTAARIVMEVTPVSEEMAVTVAAPVVATATSIVSSHITPETAEPLPVGRDYVSWTQLVPGVAVVPNGGGAKPPFDPAAKGGNNYNDRGGNPGSRDNVYLLDGFDMTDIGGGFGSLELNHEVVLEQQVITSGSPAEFAGAKGFVTNVVTRSGSNELHGSANVFVQDADWIGSRKSDDPRYAIAPDDQYDWALTLGGPVKTDAVSFFVSVQQRDASADVELTELASPVPATTEYSFTRTNVFAKMTIAPGLRDALGVLFYMDERVTKGSRSPNTPINRYGRGEDVPMILTLDYTHVTAAANLFSLTGGILERSSEGFPEYPELGPANTLLYEPGTLVPPYERLYGSAGSESTQDQQRINVQPAFTWNFDARGSHVMKAGLQFYQWYEENWNRQMDGYSLASFAPQYAGITFADAVARGFFPQGEFDYILRALQESPSSAAFAAVDANGDGVITSAELGAVMFSSRADNRDGINFLRNQDQQVGVNRVKSINYSAFVQDDWTRGRLNFQYGLRVDDWRYVASDGSTIVDMDPVFSPRFGVSWDVRGDGRQRLSAFYGRFYDPLLTPIVRFAGNLSGTVQAEQVFLGDEWFSYRLRGSATRRDAVFAPNLRNQRQDEYALTWGANVSSTLGFVAQAWHRREGSLIEDYDPIYFNRDVAGDLTLDPAQFGFGPEGPTGANYFVGNLVGGKREHYGIDLALERPFAGTWGGSVQYSWKQSKGNTNSDANTDLQGDFLNLDPRLAYMWGHLPGSVDHQVKVFGSYMTPIGLQVAGLVYWSSGAHYTEADIFRPESYNIIMNHRRADGTYAVTGDEKQPSYTQFDARLSYTMGIRGVGMDLFLDVYNVLDDQGTFLVEEGYNHPDFTYGEARSLFLPRRFEAGVRFRI